MSINRLEDIQRERDPNSARDNLKRSNEKKSIERDSGSLGVDSIERRDLSDISKEHEEIEKERKEREKERKERERMSEEGKIDVDVAKQRLQETEERQEVIDYMKSRDLVHMFRNVRDATTDELKDAWMGEGRYEGTNREMIERADIPGRVKGLGEFAKYTNLFANPLKREERDKFVENNPELTEEYLKTFEQTTVPFVRENWASGIPLSVVEKITGEQYTRDIEEIWEEAPVLTSMGTFAGSLYNFGVAHKLTGGVGPAVSESMGPGLKAVLGRAAPYLPRAANYASTFGLKGLVDESHKQFRDGEFKPGKIASETGKNAAIGSMLAGAHTLNTPAQQVLAAGGIRGAYSTTEKLLRKDQLDGKDLLDIGMDVGIGMFLTYLNADKRVKMQHQEVMYNMHHADLVSKVGEKQAHQIELVSLAHKIAKVQGHSSEAVLKMMKNDVMTGGNVDQAVIDKVFTDAGLNLKNITPQQLYQISPSINAEPDKIMVSELNKNSNPAIKQLKNSSSSTQNEVLSKVAKKVDSTFEPGSGQSLFENYFNTLVEISSQYFGQSEVDSKQVDSAIKDIQKRKRESGISEEELEEMSDNELSRFLFPEDEQMTRGEEISIGNREEGAPLNVKQKDTILEKTKEEARNTENEDSFIKRKKVYEYNFHQDETDGYKLYTKNEELAGFAASEEGRDTSLKYAASSNPASKEDVWSAVNEADIERDVDMDNVGVGVRDALAVEEVRRILKERGFDSVEFTEQTLGESHQAVAILSENQEMDESEIRGLWHEARAEEVMPSNPITNEIKREIDRLASDNNLIYQGDYSEPFYNLLKETTGKESLNDLTEDEAISFITQLDAVNEGDLKIRPDEVKGRKVISKSLENRIFNAIENRLNQGSLVEEQIGDIYRAAGLEDEEGSLLTPGYRSEDDFMTQEQGENLIKAIAVRSHALRDSNELKHSAQQDEEINDKVQELENKRRASDPEKYKDPNRLQSIRYYFQKLQQITGAPFYDIHETINEAKGRLSKERADKIENLKNVVPEFDKIMESDESLERVRKIIASKSDLKNAPDYPVDATESEVKMAKKIEEILSGYETKVRMAKFFNWYQGNHSIVDYDEYETEIQAAKEVYEEEGVEALRELLDTQEWGVIGSGYEPLSVAMPQVSSKKEMMSLDISDSNIRLRTDVDYKEQEDNIMKRLHSYMRQMDMLAEMQPLILSMKDIANENLDKLDNPEQVANSITKYLREVKGYSGSGGLIVSLVEKIYSQTSTVLIRLDPSKVVRNLAQNFALTTDKSTLVDPRNKSLSEEDKEYFERYVSQDHGEISDYFMSEKRPEAFGMGKLNAIADKLSFYSWSDNVNRSMAFWARKNQVDRALEDSENLDDIISKSDLERLAPEEQIYALKILARDGEQEFSRYLANVETREVNFRYASDERSPAEMGRDVKVLTNLMLFPRAYYERLSNAGKKVKDKKSTMKERSEAAKIIVSMIVGGLAVGGAYKKVFGKQRNPYNPVYVGNFSLGGLAIGSSNLVAETTTDMSQAITGDEDALIRVENNITRIPDMFIPFYRQAIATIEVGTDTRNIDKRSVRKLREIIDDEYERRMEHYDIERSEVESVQRILGGRGIDRMIDERDDSESQYKPFTP